jgi:3-hexulose-6-phosphate synthase
MTIPARDDLPAASARVLTFLREQMTFQMSVDVDNIPLGLAVAEAALAAGVTIVEMGTPLLKVEGVYNVVEAFRQRFPETLLLADMKTMDGGAFEARNVFSEGANIIDFLALAGPDTAAAICGVRDEFRRAFPSIPRLAFADILLPQQGPPGDALEVAQSMLEAGVDGVGLHLQLDARRANPALWQSSLLADTARAVWQRFGDRASVQVVGGLSIEQAQGLARHGLRAFVISGNLGQPDGLARFKLPPAEIERYVAEFVRKVTEVTSVR